MPDLSQSVSRRWTLYDQGEGFPMWSISHGQEMPALEYAELVDVMPVAEHEAIVAELKQEIQDLHDAERDWSEPDA